MDTTVELGEIRKAVVIGRKGFNNFIWSACPDCGKERWVPVGKEGRCRFCGIQHYRKQHYKQLKSYRKAKAKVLSQLRPFILARDGESCIVCGAKTSLQLAHVKALASSLKRMKKDRPLKQQFIESNSGFLIEPLEPYNRIICGIIGLATWRSWYISELLRELTSRYCWNKLNSPSNLVTLCNTCHRIYDRRVNVDDKTIMQVEDKVLEYWEVLNAKEAKERARIILAEA